MVKFYFVYNYLFQGFYNNNPIIANEKTDELFKELSNLKDAMVENLDKLIERDGKIEVIL